MRRIEFGKAGDQGPYAKPLPGSKITEYVWDCRDRLREVHLPSGEVVRFRYDAFARGHSNPFWKQPRGTWRGDLINKQAPTGPIHPDLPVGHRHRDRPHYNIVLQDGTKSAIIIDG